MIRILFSIIIFATTLGAQETLRQASEARLWLKVPAGSPPLRDVHVAAGHASNASWEKDPAVRERHTDIVFPIRWWSWNEITIDFTPEFDGALELTLSGPWSQDKNGKLIRQEILWDEISVLGADLQNGGFEISNNTLPASWKSPWSNYPTSDSWPLVNAQPMAGKHLASSFHDRPLVQNLAVRKDRKVSLKLHAKAATLPDFIAPKSLGTDTLAHRAAAKLKR
ncbi:MAG: hypothetical protein H8M99_16150, partial [Gloeobacteraceae cyanobacterium ES-bin-144]|nr:hypothetical protein [Verrucomicrobiales bacterium]